MPLLDGMSRKTLTPDHTPFLGGLRRIHAKGDIGTMETVVNDIASVTGKKLAVVVASHAHQDHIAGYDRFGNIFSTFEIGEVWLPWTWNPDDPQAVQLQKKQTALTQQLTQHFAALAAAQSRTSDTSQAAMDAIDNLKGNQHAIALLKAGFGVNAKVRYLKAGDSLPQPGDDPPVPGLTVSFLGPPQSTKFLAQMNPPAGQHYLQLNQGRAETANAIEPFPAKWRLAREAPAFKEAGFTSKDEKDLQNTVGSPLEALAFAIDQARNNESVVALLVYRGQYLLFPGDAQYGNWEWWLQNLRPENILPLIRFFKIAHHGSVNATPVPVLEQMADGKFAAMVSTQSIPWASIPLVKLMQRVNEKAAGKIVRSDWISVPGGPSPSTGAEPQEPSTLPEGFIKGQLWFDYMINV